MRKTLITFLLAAGVMALSGCWDQNLFEDTAMVLSAGIDSSEENQNKYEFTFAYGQTQNSQGQLATASAQGGTMEDALQTANATMERPLAIEKLHNIVISEDAAKKGAIRNSGVYYLGETSRFLADFVISERNASEVFSTITAMEMGDAAFSYLDHLLATSAQKGQCPDILRHDYNLDYLKEGIDAIFPMIAVEGEEITVVGTALFHNDTMVGKFNRSETMYLLMLLADNENTDYVVAIPFQNGTETTKATLHINKIHCKRKLSLRNDELLISFELKIYGYFDELERERLIQNFSQEDLERTVDHYISKNLNAAAKTMAQLQCDPFGIEDQIRGYHPNYYQTHDFDAAYARAKFQIKVSPTITNEGKT